METSGFQVREKYWSSKEVFKVGWSGEFKMENDTQKSWYCFDEPLEHPASTKSYVSVCARAFVCFCPVCVAYSRVCVYVCSVCLCICMSVCMCLVSVVCSCVYILCVWGMFMCLYICMWGYFMCLCVCMFCMSVYLYVCVHVSLCGMFMCLYVCGGMFMCLCVCVVCSCVSMYVCMCLVWGVCSCVYTCVWGYIHVFACMHVSLPQYFGDPLPTRLLF